ncbi:MAG: hypothetical protein Q9191_004531, partial [Dirinaria sp. TL-2023a]
MANHKYSHALVLTHYEDSGLLSHDPRRLTPSKSHSLRVHKPKPQVVAEFLSFVDSPPQDPASKSHFKQQCSERSRLQPLSDPGQQSEDSLRRSSSVVTQIYAPSRPSSPSPEEEHVRRPHIPRTASKHWEAKTAARYASKERLYVTEAQPCAAQASCGDAQTSTFAYKESNCLLVNGAENEDSKPVHTERDAHKPRIVLGRDDPIQSLEEDKEQQPHPLERFRTSNQADALDTSGRLLQESTQSSELEGAVVTNTVHSESPMLSEHATLGPSRIFAETPTPAPLNIRRSVSHAPRVDKPLPKLPDQQPRDPTSRPSRYRTRGFASPSRHNWISNASLNQTSTTDVPIKPIRNMAPPRESRIKAQAPARIAGEHTIERSKSRSNSDVPSSGTGSSNVTSESRGQSLPSPQTTPPTSPTFASISSFSSKHCAKLEQQPSGVPRPNKDMVVLPWEFGIGMGPSIFRISPPRTRSSSSLNQDQDRPSSASSSIDDATPPPILRVRPASKPVTVPFHQQHRRAQSSP